MTKKNCFKSNVAENRQNPNNLWNLIKNLTREDANDHANIRQLREVDVLFTYKQCISELLNTFFVTQPQKLLSSILTGIADVLPQGTTEHYFGQHPDVIAVYDISQAHRIGWCWCESP